MALTSGSRLGPYEVLAPLGAGGMGEVYRARDTKLGRDVAIKVVPAEVAHDAERMARFQREAQVLAALNHPHIGAIYGLEEAEGTKALILELVEGPTIADRIAQGPIPMDEALLIARQMAEALEAAHEKGIIHRDLKPANVKLTLEDQVKVLDFGLAKALSGDASSPSVVDSLTVTAQHTRPGVILGTAAYMSPEQARGKAVDKRTDIWSFGCVLYEMLTGARPFEGETTTDIIGAILHKEPDFGAVPQQTPPTIQLLLRRCLSKDRSKRIRDIGDARIEIDNAIADPSSSFLRVSTAIDAGLRTRPTVRRRVLIWFLCLIIMAALAAGWLRPRGGSPPSEAQVMRLCIPAPKASANQSGIAIAPDGRFLVYESKSDRGTPRLRLRALDQFEDRGLGSNEGAYAPFVSNDGSEVGFFTDQDMRVVSTTGGSERRVCDAFGYVSGTWGPDNTIIYSTARVGGDARPGLSRVSATGGVPEILTTVDSKKNERAHVMPEALPDGKHVLFGLEADTSRQIALLSLETRTYKVILNDASQPHYSPSGHLVFYHDSSDKVLAVPFDLATLQVTDRRTPLITDQAVYATISRNGILAYQQRLTNEGSTAVWVDRQGVETPVPLKPDSWVQPRVSPDGSKLVIRQSKAPNCFLWLFELDRTTLTRLTFDGDSHGPVWDGDGRNVIVGIELDAMRSLYKVPADGSSVPTVLWKGKGPDQPGRISNDGALLPFVEQNADNNMDIWVLSLKDEVRAAPFLQTPFREDWPSFSMDGKWIAYCSNESGRDEIYVRPYPGPGAKTLVSTDGGSAPLWSRDGKEMFYGRSNAMMCVEVTTEPDFRASAPKKLFECDYSWDRDGNYDVAPDGKRFLMIKPPGGDMPNREIRVIVNWTEELKAKDPTGAN